VVLNGDRRVGDRLPCGTDLEHLLDQVADGHSAERSTHQVTCAYCQSALDEIERLWEPVRRLAGERVVAPPGLVASVMQRVREFAVSWHDVLIRTGRGTTRIANSVVAKISGLVAGQVPGVWAVFGWAVRMSPLKTVESSESTTPDVADPAPQKVAVDLELATTYGVSMDEVAAAIRRNVAHQLHAMTGLEVTEVNVIVEEVILEE